LGTRSSEESLSRDLLCVIKGFRNGLVYGAKIRFPHALVMTFLFRQQSYPVSSLNLRRITESLKTTLKLTRQHSWNLARFVTIYKSILILLRRIQGTHKWHSFLAGCVGGYLVFASETAVNNQIVMYLLSRVLTGSIALLYSKLPSMQAFQLGEKAFGTEATLVWGAVMYLFAEHRQVLQSSLRSSMKYLYEDSSQWSSLWTLLIHNN